MESRSAGSASTKVANSACVMVSAGASRMASGATALTMNPASRKLIRVSIDEEERGETGDLVERLMGNKPEARFTFIQERAAFAKELVDV